MLVSEYPNPPPIAPISSDSPVWGSILSRMPKLPAGMLRKATPEKTIALRIIRHGGELFDSGENALPEFANDAAACVDDEAVSAVMCSGVELSAADICKLVDAGNFKFGKVCNFGQCAGAAIYGHDELIRRFILLHHCIEGVGIGCVSQVDNAVTMWLRPTFVALHVDALVSMV